MKFKIRGQINSVVLSCLVILCLIFSGIIIAITNFLINNNIETSQNTNMNYFMDTVEDKYSGAFSSDGTSLYKGAVNVKDMLILDSLKNKTKMEYTLFAYDKRVITTIEEDGLIGTSANQDVIEAVLENGQSYQDTTQIQGQTYAAYYSPIKDSAGDIVGMYFVGEPMAPYHKMLINIILSTVVLGGLCIVVACIRVALLSQRLSAPINDVLNNLNAIENRDFTQSVKSTTLKRSDEIGDLAKGLVEMKNTIGSLLTDFNNLSNEIRDHSKTLDRNSSDMSAHSERIVTITQEISASTTSQANNLIHISDIMNDFSQSIDNMSTSLEHVNTTSKEIGSLSSQSTEQMQAVTDSLKAFNNRFKDFTAQIAKFEGRVSEVNEMANIIDGISKQTNLLALNAAIEAARAGDAGKGFSVVAEEIRSLAEQSQDSTQNISEIVNGLSIASKQLATDTLAISDELSNQLTAIGENITVFSSIVNSINTVIPQIDAVSTETSNINKQKVDIVEQIDQVSSIAQNISAACEEVAASTEETNTVIEEVSNISTGLNAITHTLKQKFKTFTLQ